ncbi:hypothetical protein RAHE111665_06005 [Rariglobus hedericola]
MDVGVDFIDGGGVAVGNEFGSELGERILCEDRVEFTGDKVVAGVVSGVSAHTQDMGFDEDGARRGADLLDGGGERVGDRDHVARRGVDGEALHAVAGGALVELGAGGELLADGGRVGVFVVLDNEDDREREDGRQVEGLVDVAGAGSTVAEESEADGGFAVSALGVGYAEDV